MRKRMQTTVDANYNTTQNISWLVVCVKKPVLYNAFSHITWLGGADARHHTLVTTFNTVI